jgi:hypothetical protein
MGSEFLEFAFSAIRRNLEAPVKHPLGKELRDLDRDFE